MTECGPLADGFRGRWIATLKWRATKYSFTTPSTVPGARAAALIDNQYQASVWRRLLFVAVIPCLEQFFFLFKPRLFLTAFCELRSDAALKFRRERLVPIESRFGCIGNWAKFQALAQSLRDVTSMKPGGLATGWDI